MLTLVPQSGWPHPVFSLRRLPRTAGFPQGPGWRPVLRSARLQGERSATTEVVQLLGNACLSPTTLAPKDPFRSCEPRWILWFSLFSEEPHRVTSNDLVGALGAIPAAWLATVSRRCHSVDVFQQGRFLFPCQPLTSPLPRSQPKCIKGQPFCKQRLPESPLVYLRLGRLNGTG